MKRAIEFFLLTLIPLFTYSQEIQQKNVPAVVLNAYQLKFSNATDIKWKLEKGNYHVSFEVNDKDHELVMNDKGNVLKHQQDLYVSEISKVILETIRSKVAFFDVSDADKLEESGKITYSVNFEINGKDHDFLIGEKGELIKYTKELKDSEVPAPIATLIKTKYGSLDIDDARLTEEGGKLIYRLEGEINDMDHVFIFNDKATVLKHEQDLRNSDIPVQVMKAVEAAYNGYEIQDADLIDEGGRVIYDLELRKSKEKVVLILNPEGKIIEVRKG